jgi:hypothetical protein
LHLSVSLLVLPTAAPAASARCAVGQGLPEIKSVKIESARNPMLRLGQFCKANRAVLLGKLQLEVVESSQTWIVAKLPPDLLLATHQPLIGSPPSYLNAKPIYLLCRSLWCFALQNNAGGNTHEADSADPRAKNCGKFRQPSISRHTACPKDTRDEHPAHNTPGGGRSPFDA